MPDLNVMLREQALTSLNAQLSTAVTNGDTEAALKVSDEIAKLHVQTAPKAPPFTSADVWRAAEAKAPWLGVDPKKSALANEFAKSMNISKFANPEAMAEAVIKAVDEASKPVVVEPVVGEDPDADPEDDDKKPEPKAKKTDGPGEGDANVRSSARAASGPWTKLAQAPADVQKEVKRQADKFLSAKATKEQREAFTAKALESHYQAHQRKAGKK